MRVGDDDANRTRRSHKQVRQGPLSFADTGCPGLAAPGIWRRDSDAVSTPRMFLGVVVSPSGTPCDAQLSRHRAVPDLLPETRQGAPPVCLAAELNSTIRCLPALVWMRARRVAGSCRKSRKVRAGFFCGRPAGGNDWDRGNGCRPGRQKSAVLGVLSACTQKARNAPAGTVGEGIPRTPRPSAGHSDGALRLPRTNHRGGAMSPPDDPADTRRPPASVTIRALAVAVPSFAIAPSTVTSSSMLRDLLVQPHC